MKKNYLFKVLFAAMSALPFASFGQMVGSDIFLKGKYVEVGIGHLGYYGSDAIAPGGYHPHGSTKLGFVADPGMTSWGTGSGSH